MIVAGSIYKVMANGYERLVTLKVNHEIVVIFTFMDCNRYVDEECELTHLFGNEIISVKLKLIMGSVVEGKCAFRYKFDQPIKNSPHTIVNGKITSVDKDSMLLAVELYGELEVGLEEEFDFMLGSFTTIKGELISDEVLNVGADID